jgi:hypothetical protein
MSQNEARGVLWQALKDLAEWADITTRGDTTTHGRKIELAYVLKNNPVILSALEEAQKEGEDAPQ